MDDFDHLDDTPKPPIPVDQKSIARLQGYTTQLKEFSTLLEFLAENMEDHTGSSNGHQLRIVELMEWATRDLTHYSGAADELIGRWRDWLIKSETRPEPVSSSHAAE